MQRLQSRFGKSGAARKLVLVQIIVEASLIRGGFKTLIRVSSEVFSVRNKATGNTEHMFSQCSFVGTGNREQGTSQPSEARRPAGPPEAKAAKKKFGGGILKGTGNRGQGTGNMPCSPSVPGTCSGTTPGKPIAACQLVSGWRCRCVLRDYREWLPIQTAGSKVYISEGMMCS